MSKATGFVTAGEIEETATKRKTIGEMSLHQSSSSPFGRLQPFSTILREVLERFNANTAVVRWRRRSVWPSAPRDLVLLCHTARVPEGTLILARSTEHARAPESEEYVRAELFLAQLCAVDPAAPLQTHLTVRDGGATLELFTLNCTVAR